MRRLTATRYLLAALSYGCLSFSVAEAADFTDSKKPILFDALPDYMRYQLQFRFQPISDIDNFRPMKNWFELRQEISKTLTARFNKAGQALFAHGFPLKCKIRFDLEQDLHIAHVQVLEASINPHFNMTALRIIRSLENDSTLTFPTTSKCRAISVVGTFVWQSTDGYFKPDDDLGRLDSASAEADSETLARTVVFDPVRGGPVMPLSSQPIECAKKEKSVSADPDHTPDMALAWDLWHKKVAEEIYQRFNSAAQANFKHSPPLVCQVSYMVARDRRIGNVRVLKCSDNETYDTMLVTVIKSMAGNPLLGYPAGSKRRFVEKSGTFTWNHSLGGVDTSEAPKPQVGPRMLAK